MKCVTCHQFILYLIKVYSYVDLKINGNITKNFHFESMLTLTYESMIHFESHC